MPRLRKSRVYSELARIFGFSVLSGLISSQGKNATIVGALKAPPLATRRGRTRSRAIYFEFLYSRWSRGASGRDHLRTRIKRSRVTWRGKAIRCHGPDRLRVATRSSFLLLLFSTEVFRYLPDGCTHQQ